MFLAMNMIKLLQLASACCQHQQRNHCKHRHNVYSLVVFFGRVASGNQSPSMPHMHHLVPRCIKGPGTFNTLTIWLSLTCFL